MNHDPVVRAVATALRNLAIDPRNKDLIGVFIDLLLFVVIKNCLSLPSVTALKKHFSDLRTRCTRLSSRS